MRRLRHRAHVRATKTCSTTSAGTIGISMTSRVRCTQPPDRPVPHPGSIGDGYRRRGASSRRSAGSSRPSSKQARRSPSAPGPPGRQGQPGGGRGAGRSRLTNPVLNGSGFQRHAPVLDGDCHSNRGVLLLNQQERVPPTVDDPEAPLQSPSWRAFDDAGIALLRMASRANHSRWHVNYTTRKRRYS